MGLSVGSIFILYAPLNPSVYSLGGIALALGMLCIAKLYSKILTINYFYKISLFVEVVILFVMIYFLIFSYSYTTALLIYIGYQTTFTFGSYLVRAETLFLKKSEFLSFVDVAKQKGYLFGMLISYLFYQGISYFFSISDKQDQVYNIHFLLLLIQVGTIYFLMRAFKK